MLTQETKRKIDSARQILVGKVPDPKAQIDQITTALIYKFMDDMDKDAMELGGKARFFTNGFEKYAWSKILDPKLGGHDRLELYAEAITKLWQNNHLPQLFRDIFKDAFLPYRSPETLSLFLKEINGFTYNHSEDLGDAFEYLLSIMSSQGDAGQFRTPRHIIDFITEVVDPKKDESILDPACGTAGFLISAYKHILKQHDGKDDPDRKEKPLTPDDKKKLMNNLVGYDISPDMVKLSKVNMYLHGFAEPKIYEYDTLSSDEKWDEMYDVIMANPPFMSPKGGIRPHKRFSVQANRAEVLFVDYIKEHLRPNGRAGVIVPEGIIFQSGTAYKQLRKLLVEDGLFAVVSLPSGVFNPYSGVKTSILFLDNQLAKQSDSILFVKVDSDGYGLGAQRRETGKSDLPLALMLIDSYKRNIVSQNLPKTDKLEKLTEKTISIFVPKSKIRDIGDYYLTGERYREINTHNEQKWPMVELGEVCQLQRGLTYSSKELGGESNGIPFYNLKSIKRNGSEQKNDFKYFTGEIKNKHLVEIGDILVALTDLTPTSEIIGSPKLITDDKKAAYSADLAKVIFVDKRVNVNYLYNLLRSKNYRNHITSFSQGANVKHLQVDGFYRYRIPLPPIDIQEKLVKQIEGYQKIIDGARQIAENWKANIEINHDWKTTTIGDICTLVRGSSPRPKGDKRLYGGDVPRLMVSDVTRDGMYTTPKTDTLTEAGAKLSRPMKKGEVVMAVSGNPGLPTILAVDACIHDGFVGFRDLSENIIPEFLYFVLLHQKERNSSQSVGAVFKNLTTGQIKEFKIPIPSLDEQKEIVAKVKEQLMRIEEQKTLAWKFELKIQQKVSQLGQNFPHFNDLFLQNSFEDDFGWNPQWNEEIEKWLDYIEQKDSDYYKTHRNRAKNPKQRDELLGEYKAAYIIEEKCGGQVIEFEPSGLNSSKYDFSFKDKNNSDWYVEVKSPSWRSVVSKEVDEKYFRELRGAMTIVGGEKYPECKAEIICPTCGEKVKFVVSNIENSESTNNEIKNLVCPKCKSNLWRSSEEERSTEKAKRLSLPQFINAEGRWLGFDIFEEAIINSLGKFEAGKNNLLILCPNSFAEMGFLGAMENWHRLREMVKRLDKENKLTAIGVFEVSLGDKFNYQCSFIDIKGHPSLNDSAAIYFDGKK